MIRKDELTVLDNVKTTTTRHLTAGDVGESSVKTMAPTSKMRRTIENSADL
jgi:hypothetical protein